MAGNAKEEWLVGFLGIDPASYPDAAAAGASAAAEPAGGAPAARPGGPAAAGKQAAKADAKPAAFGAQNNPFDAPAARVEIEKLALPTIQRLAVEQAQNAARDFQAALRKVRAAKKATTDADAAQKEMIYSLLLTIALMPLGPVMEAAGNAIAGPKLRSALAETLADHAGALEAKFGSKAVGKTFDFVTGDAVTKLAEKFDAAKAKGILDKGMETLKGKTVKFAASSDDAVCTTNYLDALEKSANDAMHNLTDFIGTTTSYSEAIAFYNLFSQPLQASYEAVLSVQVDDMLRELKDVLATKGKPETIAASEYGSTEGTEEIAEVAWKGRPMLAHVRRIETVFIGGANNDLVFVKWVTPDMQMQAARMVKEKTSGDAFKNQHVPEPNREPGERVIAVDYHGAEKLMLINIEDTGWFTWTRQYGVREFKRWADDEEDEKALRSRGAMQIGGIDKVAIGTIKGVPR